MRIVRHDLLTNKYTKVFHEDDEDIQFDAPHHFVVTNDDTVIERVNFQKGPILENGINGVANEDLIAMVITRLEYFQKTGFSCRENAMAITKLEESLLWLRKRTMGRERRGVEGTSIK